MQATYGVILFSLLLFGCRQTEPIGRSELQAYVANKTNNLKKEQTVDGVRVEVMYRPSSLLVAQELEPLQVQDTSLIKNLEDKYSNHYYFIIKFSKENKEAIRQLGSFGNYSSMLQVLAFNMQNHISLRVEEDIIPVADYYFDQTYGMSNGNTILVSFNKMAFNNKNKFEIYISECGLGTGDIKFSFDRRDLEDTPRLDYRSIN